MKISVLVFVITGVAVAAPTPELQNVWQIGNPVETTSGTLVGHAAPWPENSGVSEYLGIPFAEPPVGKLRWKKPVPFKGNGTITGANKFGFDCPQILQFAVDGLKASPAAAAANIPKDILELGSMLGVGPDNNFDEDCLNLNVWTKPQVGERKKAVLVWIYGGATSVGATSAGYYNPARYAAEHDIVAVSINYRLNIFGFPMFNQLPDQNFGLWDQRLAIEWIRDNIEKFGGDPKRITIFGESAGGASVDSYAYAWTKDPIVNGFIAESGTAAGLPGDTPNGRSWYQASKAIGCGTGDNLPCMQNKSWQDLMKGVDRVGPAGGMSSVLSFWPTIDNVLVFKNIHERQEKGQFIKRPILVGSNHNEGGILTGMGTLGINYAKTLKNLPYLAQQLLNTVVSIANGTGAYYDTIRGSLHFIEDGVFNCPAAAAAAARSRAGVPSWRYRYMGTFNNTIIGGQGAYHLAEVPIVMGTSGRKSKDNPNTPEQEETIRNVMNAWATFAKDPDHGLEKLGWPKYNPQGNSLVQLAYKNSPTPTFAKADAYDNSCKYYKYPPGS